MDIDSEAPSLEQEQGVKKESFIKSFIDKKKLPILLFTSLCLLFAFTFISITLYRQSMKQTTRNDEKLTESIEKHDPDEESATPQTTPFPFFEADESIILLKDNQDSVKIYSLNLETQEESEILEIPKQERDYYPGKRKPIIQFANNGMFAYSYGDTYLYHYNGNSLTRRLIAEGKRFDFALSPDGETVIIFTKKLEDSDAVRERADETGNWDYTIQNNFYQVSMENETPPELLLQKDLIDDYSFTGITHYIFVEWSHVQTNNPLIQRYRHAQIFSTYNGLYELDIENRELIEAFPSVPREIFADRLFLSTSADQKYLAYANLDGACCGGINYSNDQTYIYDVSANLEVKAFDEHERYGNAEETHTEQHQTVQVSFSPNNDLVAQTIFSLFRADPYDMEETTSASLLITDINGVEKAFFNDYTLIDWLDNGLLLAAKTTDSTFYFTWTDWSENAFSSIDVINIDTGEIQTIYEGSFSQVIRVKATETPKLEINTDEQAERVPASVISYQDGGQYTILELDYLEINPDFQPGMTPYLLNKSPATINVILDAGAKFMNCFYGEDVGEGPTHADDVSISLQ